MPVTGTPTPPARITEDNIRMFMRDYALGHLPGGQGNILLDTVQFTPEEVTNAIDFAVEAYNALTPISSFTEENFPNRYVLLIGTARFLLMSESFHQLRNQATVQDGDIAPTGIYDKAQAYLGLAQALQAEWQDLAKKMKTQANMEGAYGSVGSGYRYIGRGRYGL
jgi:hypothetical protein